MPDLAILYEHPRWFSALFAALDARGVDYAAIHIDDHRYDPASRDLPAPVIFNRVAMSSFLREPEHPLFYTAALLDHWRGQGATVLNGPEVMAIDSSKARQLSLLGRLGLATPRTRVVHRAADLAHDTFLRLLSREEPLALQEPRAFLTTVAQRVLGNHWRREQLERALEQSPRGAPVLTPKGSPAARR